MQEKDTTNKPNTPSDPISQPSGASEDYWELEDRRNLIMALAHMDAAREMERLLLKESEDYNFYQAIQHRIQIGVDQGMEQGIAIGMQSGLKQGVKQGIEQGIQQGLERGLEQGLEKGISIGMRKGLEQGTTQGIIAFLNLCKQQGLSSLTASLALQKEFHLDTKQTANYMDQFW